jgi:hypothetical protein
MATMLTIDGERKFFDAAVPLRGTPRPLPNDRFECSTGNKERRAADAHIARLALNLTGSSPLRSVWNCDQWLLQHRRIEQPGIGLR